jgi:hypothetical protein
MQQTSNPSTDNCANSFKVIVQTLLILLFSNTGIKAQKEFDEIRGTQHWIQFSDATNSLYHYIAGQAYAYLDKRSDKISRIHSLPEWQQRQEWIRNTLRSVVGPFPAKTALHARVTQSIEKDGYRLEDILFESQPGYYVTSSLFIPDQFANARGPVIIYCIGHTFTGYAASQVTLLNLVKKGFIVFAFDPMGQGERLQYYNPKTGRSRFKYPSYEHSYAGAQLFITGNTLARDFIWDGIRAVDYLLTRKEVDPSRIGISGRSGGGTQSAYIAAFDDRIKAAAPENYITNFTRLFQSMGPQDAEQDFFNGIGEGIDMADLLLVRAPKPALIITTSRDMFPIQGSLETAKEVSRIYKAYNKPSNFAMVMDDAPHASTKKNRESMYAFFEKVLNNPGDSTDREVNLVPREELQVTSTGQIATSLKGESVYSLNYRDVEKRMSNLKTARKNVPGYFPELLRAAKKLSGYREPTEVQAPVFAGRIQREGYVIEKYLVKGEGSYMIPYLLFRPETSNKKALIYLNSSGKSAAAEVGGPVEWFVKKGVTVLVPDLVGIGELGPGVFRGDSYIDSVSYNIWFAAMLIGRSIAGIQAGDVVRLVKLLKRDLNMHVVYGLAGKQMAPVMLHAAAFDSDISKVALIRPYSSYRSVVMNPEYDPDFLHSTVPGSIGVYDLPDLAASLAPRSLLLAGVTDGNGSSMNTAEIQKDLSVIESAYQSRGPGALEIIPEGPDNTIPEHLTTWMEK